MTAVEWTPEEAAQVAAELDGAATHVSQLVAVELARVGPSYRVTHEPTGLALTFRDVRTDGELAADVSIDCRGSHLFRTTSTLSITTRDRLARTAADFGGANGEAPLWRSVIFASVEAVLEAEESLGGGADLRTCPLTSNGRLHVIRPTIEDGSNVLVSPGDGGKSTLARALAVSVAGGLAVVPGMDAVTIGPVLYVAGEDAVTFWHARSVEAICRGLEIDRASLANPITLLDETGKPIHRIARAIAERAADFALVIIDPLSAFLAAGDQVRDRDSLFWRAIDTVGRPTLILAHPNRAESRNWGEADGRIAGSEINRDRVRLMWAAQWKDESATFGSSYRRYTLENTKRNHGAHLAPLGFAVNWTFGLDDDDPGTVRFEHSEPFKGNGQPHRASKQVEETLEAMDAGATTPAALMRALSLGSIDTAKSRLRTAKAWRGEDVLEGGEV
ncbi:MAG: AAA family ATPase [Candidatus Limnocylindrales bacterium]